VDLLLPALGALVVIAAVVAVAASDPRLGVVGLAAAMALAPLIADPLPDPVAVGARIVAAALAAALLRAAARADPLTRGTRIGWPADLALAAAAFVAGWAAHDFSGGGLGPPAALAAGAALAAVAAPALVDRHDRFRIVVGVMLAITAADLAATGMAEPASAGASLLVAAVTALAAAVGAILVPGPAGSVDPAGPPRP
jgi:hypothetical protein